MSNKIKNVAIFCASRHGTNPLYTKVANDLGCMCAAENLTSYYGGGIKGLMGEFALAANNAGGKVIAIAPEIFRSSAEETPDNIQVIMTETMGMRKTMLIESVDAFFVLPGGVGTLEEIAEAVTFNYLEMAKGADAVIRPLVLMNVDGLFDKVKGYYEDSVEAGLTDPAVLDIMHFVESVEEAQALVQIWKNYPPEADLEHAPEMAVAALPKPAR